MKLKTLIVTIVLIIATAGATYLLWSRLNHSPKIPMQSVTLTTSDGVRISANYVSPTSIKGGVVLVHMMPATKESWEPMQQTLGQANVASIAIDLRGHGQSTQGPNGLELNYNNFSDNDHAFSRYDVDAAVQYLVDLGISKNHIIVMGASIGANLAIEKLALDPQLNGAVLLSPGLDFQGIETEQYAHALAPTQALYTLASDDDQYSYDSSQKLYDATSVQKNIETLHGIGHGTAMIDAKPELKDTITAWILNRIEQN